jgi:hypothetical protein
MFPQPSGEVCAGPLEKAGQGGVDGQEDRRGGAEAGTAEGEGCVLPVGHAVLVQVPASCGDRKERSDRFPAVLHEKRAAW